MTAVAVHSSAMLGVAVITVLLSVLELKRRQREPEFEILWLRRSLLVLAAAVMLLAARAIGENSFRERDLKRVEAFEAAIHELQAMPQWQQTTSQENQQ